VATTVTLSVTNLPDATATKHDDGTYEFSVTGLAGLATRPRTPTALERADGISSSDPPTVRGPLLGIELLLLRAVEMALPDGTLDNLEGVEGAVDKEQLLLAQLTRVVRRLSWKLDVPS
jgi:hypothetical protein